MKRASLAFLAVVLSLAALLMAFHADSASAGRDTFATGTWDAQHFICAWPTFFNGCYCQIPSPEPPSPPTQ